MFKCDKCGECCRHLNLSPLYSELDSGNGVCKYLDGNLCSIYESRPLICRVDEGYDAFFSDTMTKEKFYEINYSVCEKFKNTRRK